VQSYFSVRNKQNQLLRDYENDLLKPSNHIKIASLKRIFDSIDKQLAKDNHKFMMSLLGSHARLRDYDAEIK
jgi:hypothetical protein